MTRADSDFVLVGRVRRPHGVRGEVVVESETDVAGRFAVGSELELVTAGCRRTVRVAASRGRGPKRLIRFAGVADRDEAERLRGARLEVAIERTPPAAPESYYYFELLGCRCRDRARGALGQVVDVIEDGGGLLLEISDGERSLLVPFVRRYLLAVDREGRTIQLDLPAGLIETCASRS